MAVKRDYRALGTKPAKIFCYNNGESEFSYRAEWRPNSSKTLKEVVDTVLSGRGFSNVEEHVYNREGRLKEDFEDQHSEEYAGELKIESSEFTLIYRFNPDIGYKNKVELRSYVDDLELLDPFIRKLY